MSSDAFGLDWQLSFRCVDGALFREKALLGALVDAIGETAWWRELDVLGHDAMPGKPVKTPAAAKKVIASGKRDVFVLARGEPAAAARIDQTDLFIQLDVMDDQLELRFGALGDALRRLGGAAIDDVLDVIGDARETWKGALTLEGGGAAAVGIEEISYKRVRPPRRWAGTPPRDAVVDLLDASSAPGRAAVPEGVTRVERDGLVVLRWVSDVRDPDAVAAAAGRHEAWLAGLVETDVDPGYNEHGDQYVQTFPARPRAPLRFMAKGGVAYLDVPASKGKLDPAAWKKAEALARAGKLPDGTALSKLRVIAPSRELALASAAAARKAGIDAVVYETADGYWDPDPPGPWFTPEELAALRPGKAAKTKDVGSASRRSRR